MSDTKIFIQVTLININLVIIYMPSKEFMKSCKNKLVQWLKTLAPHLGSPGSCKKYWCLGPTKDSDLIGLGMGIYKSFQVILKRGQVKAHRIRELQLQDVIFYIWG